MMTDATYQLNFFKNNKNLVMVMICSLGLILSSCGGDDGTPTDPGDNGDNDPPGNGDEVSRLVSYSQDIQPIFNGNCATSGCHDSGTQQSGVDLTSYDAATGSVGDQYGENIISAGDPDSSPIVDKINDDPEFGVRMPEGGGALSPAQIDSIVAWIDDGAPEN